MPKKLFCLMIVFSAIMMMMACGKKKPPEDDKRFLGNWHYKRLNRYKLMTFNAQGAWEGEIRGGRHPAKGPEKKEKIKGTWQASQNQLQIVPAGTDEDAGWVAGQPLVFEVIEISEETMKLHAEETGVETFARTHKHSDKEGRRHVASIMLKPLIVNLMTEEESAKPRYLCVELELILKHPDLQLKKAITVHPKARETILFYLSSRRYAEINTMPKLQKMAEDLYRLLYPYMGDNLQQVNIKKIIVTSRWKQVEEFVGEQQKQQKEQKEEQKNTAAAA